MTNLVDRVREAIRAGGMLREKEPVGVALSGGADSCALLHCLKFGLGYPVTALHLNHRLRGEEAERDQRFVRMLCEKWELPLIAESAEVRELARAEGLSLEVAGRRARYAFFARAAGQGAFERVATAHTLSDQAETLLLNLARGSALRGLRGIPPMRPLGGGAWVIRPLLGCERSEVEEYCAENGIAFVTDSTNLADDFGRNRIRHQAMPALLSMNPRAAEAMGRTAELLGDAAEYLRRQANAAREQCRWGNGLGAEPLAALPAVLRREILAILLEEQGIEVSAARVAGLEQMLADGGRAQLPAGKTAYCRGGILTIRSEPPPLPPFATEIVPGTVVQVGAERYRAELENAAFSEIPGKVQKKLLYLGMDYDRIIGNLILRQRRPGDRAALVHRGEKALKKLFIDEKLTAYEKSAIPLLCDDEGIAGVFGFGPAARCAVTPATRRLLWIVRENPPFDEDAALCKR